jgi:hypothetical protein
MSHRPPDFDDLLEGVERPEERARLRRVHELLVEAGPPPELSPALSSVSPPRSGRRRWLAGLALAAALAVTAFAIGYLAGDSPDDASAMRVRQTVQLAGAGNASGVINLGYKGTDGNWPMKITVNGLKHLSGGDYYRLALTQDGEPKVTCGTFNVGRGKTTIEMVAAYNLEGFDGWVITLWNADTHDEKPVLWTAEPVSA